MGRLYGAHEGELPAASDARQHGTRSRSSLGLLLAPSGKSLSQKPELRSRGSESNIRRPVSHATRHVSGITPSLHNPITPFLLLAIEHINHLAQPAIILAIKVEGDARQLDMLVVLHFLGRWLDALDGGARVDVGEVLIHRFERRIAGRVLEPDYEQVLHKASGVEVAVEPRDDPHRLVGVIGDLVEA